MRLEQTLAELREKFSKMIPAEPAAVMAHHVEFLRSSGTVDQILKPGAKAPAFTLKNQHGEDVSSTDLLKRGPLVVSFTRLLHVEKGFDTEGVLTVDVALPRLRGAFALAFLFAGEEEARHADEGEDLQVGIEFPKGLHRPCVVASGLHQDVHVLG